MTADVVVPIPRTDAYPYPMTGVFRDAHGIAYYEDVPESLVAMLRAHVEQRPDAEAVVELGGRRLTYRQLWAAAERVAIRYPAGVDWVLAFWGTIFAGGVAVAVNIRLALPEVEFVLGDCGSLVDLAPEAAVVAVPDDVMGEKVGAVLVGIEGAEPDVDSVLAHCRERLADYKIPQFVSAVAGPLPRNAGGKLLKARLRSDVTWGAPSR